jgi:SAM-dependent methyltransferase
MAAETLAVSELLAHLQSRKKSNEEWIASLEKRKIEELKFHDEDRDVSRASKSEHDDHARDTSNRKYYLTTQISRQWTQNWIQQHSKGKVVLDFACGNGVNAIAAAEAGASLAIGLDISEVSVKNCREVAEKKNLKNTFFIQGDCEHTELPENSIDVVICSGMLHHLDLSYAFYELRRIMKPGGVLLGIEALHYNPVIAAYRRLTPHLRTDFEKEHILGMKDITFGRRFFELGEMRFWHLFSIGAVLFRSTPLFGPALSVANLMDSVALRIPGLRLMAWMFTFEFIKPRKE